MGRSPAALGAGGLVDAGFTVSNSVPQGVKVGFEGGIGMGIPGTPFGFSTGMRNKDERLPEMDSWVNRAVIERAFKGTRAGLDPEALMDLEAQQGQFKSPAVGALAAAAATKKFLPSAGNTGAAIAALLGAGGGAMYHHKTEDSRRQSMLDALRGVYAERGPPIQGQAQVTSHEAPAMITSNAGGDA